MGVSVKLKKRYPLILGTALTGSLLAQAEEQRQSVTDGAPIENETLVVSGSESSQNTGDYLAKDSSAATGLQLGPLETPQVVTTVTYQQIRDFALDDLEDLLSMTPGVSVERVETDRTYYTARGFDIINFQLDGIGVPSVYGVQIGNRDTAIYDKVEVLKGANGLMSGFGSPSATVNLVRKRPGVDTDAGITATYGAWQRKRLQGEVSGALNDSGSIRGLFVGAFEDKASYLDRYETRHHVGYAAIEADLSETTLLTFGYSYQSGDSDSPLWGALPLRYSNGSPTNYPVSSSTSADWSRWDNEQQDAFLELQQLLKGGWTLTGRLTRSESESDSALFYVYGVPDQATGTGLFAYPSYYEQDVSQTIVDLRASGPFQLGGRTHDLLVGAQWYRSDIEEVSLYGQGIGTPLTEEEVLQGTFPEPSFDAARDGSDFEQEQTSFYTAARFSLSDPLSLLAGFRVSRVNIDGTGYGISRDVDIRNEVVPYAGLMVSVNEELVLYTSYTAIFEPQEEVDVNRDGLDPVDGVSYEAGVKTLLNDGRAEATFAVFRSEQDNVAELAGTFGDGTNYYRGVEGLTSNGFELEYVGEILSGWKLSSGYTYVDLENSDGEAARTFIPRHFAKVATTYQLPTVPMVVGTIIRWQDEVETDAAKQVSVTLVDIMARYDVSDNWSAQFNVTNLTDKKYLNSLYWDQGFYGEPRSASVSINWSL